MERHHNRGSFGIESRITPFEKLLSVMGDERARTRDRLEAGKWLADRAFGRSVQALDVDMSLRLIPGREALDPGTGSPPLAISNRGSGVVIVRSRAIYPGIKSNAFGRASRR